MLTSKERAYLRGLANSIDPIFQIGKGGINENQLKQINDALEKRELAKMAATTLPVVSEVSAKGTDIAKFIINLANATKNVDGEKSVEITLNELSTALQTSNSRLVEILTYVASLSPEDIQKIITHSIVETMDTEKE